MFGSLLGGGKPKTTSTQTVQVPSWLDSKNQSLAKRAETASKTAFTPYTGQRIFDFSPDTLNAFQSIRSQQGKYQPLIDQSSGILSTLASRAGGPTSAQLTERMNPFLDNVLDSNRRRTIEDFQNQSALNSQNKALAGAFGGSRFAVREAMNQRDLLNTLGDTDYKARFDAFNNAQSQFNQENANMGAVANQLAALAGQGQALDSNDITNLLNVGNAQQVRQQAQLDTNYEDWDREQAYPYEQINFLANILNPLTGAYRSQTQTSTQDGGSGSGLGKAVGTALSIASIFSDKRLKTDIDKVGELDNGLPVYSYRYKDGGPQQIGLMAQDVEKVNPDAVTKDKASGYKKVNYGEATKKFAEGGEVGETRQSAAKRLIAASVPNSMQPMDTPGFKDPESSFTDLSGLQQLWGGGGATENIFGSPVQNIFDESTGKWGTFTGSGPGLDWGDFGDIGTSIGGFFGFAEGGEVSTSADEFNVRPETRKYVADLLKEYSPEDILMVAEPQRNSAMTLQDGSPMWTIGEIEYLKSLVQNQGKAGYKETLPESTAFADGGQVTSKGWTPLLFQELLQEKPVKSSLPPSGPMVPMGMNAPQGVTPGKTGLQDAGQRIRNITGKTAPPPLPIENKDKNTYNDLGDLEANPELVVDEVPAGTTTGAMPQMPSGNGMPSMDDLMRNITSRPTVAEDLPPRQQESGINIPLLLAGINMLTSKGDFFEQAGAGFEGYLKGQNDILAKEEAEVEKAQKAKQQEFDNQLNLMKLQAYQNQINASIANANRSSQRTAKDILQEESLRLKNAREQIKLDAELKSGKPINDSYISPQAFMQAATNIQNSMGDMGLEE